MEFNMLRIIPTHVIELGTFQSVNQAMGISTEKWIQTECLSREWREHETNEEDEEAFLQIKPNEVMKEGVSLFIPVPGLESRISKRYNTIPSGTLNPNADELAYLLRLVQKSFYSYSQKSSGPAILISPQSFQSRGIFRFITA
ncbi:hypothetical protein QYF36_005298 [Acer negundo]|nr:hypothetical protein QYF36_005298 [Acer negundo]